MEQQQSRGSKLKEFPYLLESHKDTMVGLISAVENRLGSHLLPSSVPPDVEYYQNDSGSSQGTLYIRCGIHSSPIDCILASWLHLEQPTGAFDITNIAGYLKSSTDVPHFQFELVQCSPTYFILFLDLIPRKDIVLHPDYLKTYYEDTKIEALRQRLDQLSEVKPYFSSSLYFRCVVSPTGILVSIKCEDGGTERVEEIIREHVGPISNEIMGIWMDMCIGKGVEVGETERAVLEKRDTLIKSKAIEMDLSSSMPKQFGQEVADRVLRVIKSAFKT
uniref:Red chlorophyll catabolite reductase n=1 Tax=Fagus sylvatica TaxID=28930 RepID=A0A2N9H0P1_FAGSY